MLGTLAQLARRRAAAAGAQAGRGAAAAMLEGSSLGGVAASGAAAVGSRAGTAGDVGRQVDLAWRLQLSRGVVGGPSVSPEQAAVIGKARRMAGPVGLLAGVFGSIVGVGGGVIIVPTIVSACKTIPQRVVSGTSLAAVLATALTSAYTYTSSGCVDLAAAALISPAAMLTAPLGARLTSRLNCTALRRILGYFLLAAAPLVPLKAYLLSSDSTNSVTGEDPGSSSSSSSSSSSNSSQAELAAAAAAASLKTASSSGGDSTGLSIPSALSAALQAMVFPEPAKAAVLVATGAVAGIASGLLGVGGGLIVTPLLALAMPYAQPTVLGTSLLSMIPPASAALAQHHRLGNVDWRMAAVLAAGTAVGSVAGSNAAVQAPPGYLEAAFCIGMLFLGKKTLATAK